MGTYYLYVNETRKEYFFVDPTGQEIKMGCVGNNFGSRALSLLLLDDPTGHNCFPSHEMLGSWIGDRFRITGDEYEPRMNEIEQAYENIGNSVIEMMAQVEPDSFIAHTSSQWLIYYATHMDTMQESVRRRLLKHFRTAHNERPSDQLAEIVMALRPKGARGDNGG